MTYKCDIEPLRHWFLQNKRDFPWRQAATPYHVWVSEVMLQQTQADRVIGYYQKWMELFPTIQHLANASLESVLKAWEGLGYYSRAKALHQAAHFVIEKFDGILPCDQEKLKTIKGLGPYTVGAILAFGFHQKAAACDGNVLRVLSRLFEIEEDISKASTREKLRLLEEKLLPNKKPWEIAEAFIELGATVCRKKPICYDCPLQAQCLSFRHGTQNTFPVNSKQTKYETLFREVAVIVSQEKVLLCQAKEGSICAGLWEFPFFQTDIHGMTHDALKQSILETLKISPVFQNHLPQEKQSFTRFRLTLFSKLFSCDRPVEISGHTWHPIASLENLAFSSGHKRILGHFKQDLLTNNKK